MDMTVATLVGTAFLGVVAEIILLIIEASSSKYKTGCTSHVSGTYLHDEQMRIARRVYNIPVIRYTVGGTTYEDTSVYYEHLGSELKRPEKGCPVTVYHDPKDPTRFYPVGYGMEGKPIGVRKAQIAIAIGIAVVFVLLVVYYKFGIQGVPHARPA